MYIITLIYILQLLFSSIQLKEQQTMTNKKQHGSSVHIEGSSKTISYEVVRAFTEGNFSVGLYRVEYEQFKGLLARYADLCDIQAEVRVYEHGLAKFVGDESYHEFFLRGHYVQSSFGIRTRKKITHLKDSLALEFMLNTDLLPSEVRKIIHDGQLGPELT